MRVLITGCEGFIGSLLADLLRRDQLELFGIALRETANLASVRDHLHVHYGDLLEEKWVADVVAEVLPDVVFHLAAQSLVTVSWSAPEETLRTNIFGTLHLLNAIRSTKRNPVVLAVSSSAVLGPRTLAEVPLGEDHDFRPTSAYAVSKVGEEMLGFFFWKVLGIRVIRVRPFNMTGPGKLNDACSDFARGIVEIEYGTKKVLDVGNLETVRDFTDGRDAAKALWLLARRGEAGEVYNLCSSTPIRMAEVLAKLISMARVAVEFRSVTHRLRPFDDPVYVGDNSKLMRLGWRPEIPFDQTLSDLLGYWRKELRES